MRSTRPDVLGADFAAVAYRQGHPLGSRGWAALWVYSCHRRTVEFTGNRRTNGQAIHFGNPVKAVDDQNDPDRPVARSRWGRSAKNAPSSRCDIGIAMEFGKWQTSNARPVARSAGRLKVLHGFD
jgi:hypothetical protein